MSVPANLDFGARVKTGGHAHAAFGVGNGRWRCPLPLTQQRRRVDLVGVRCRVAMRHSCVQSEYNTMAPSPTHCDQPLSARW